MNSPRRFVCLLTSLCLLLGMISVGRAETNPKKDQSGDYSYLLLADGTAQITLWRGTAQDLEVPGELDGHPVTSIGDNAFSYCEALTSVTLPDSVAQMVGNPFENCAALRTIMVSPDHPYLATMDGVLVSKPDQRLICYPGGCTDAEYAIPQGIQIIGDRAFSSCTALASITIPNSVTAIESRAFSSCTALASVTIPDGVTSIGDWAFSSCGALVSVTLSDSVAQMGNNPFESCDALRTIVVSPDHSYLATMDGALVSKPDQRLICYPSGYTDAEYEIPQGIQTIGGWAFCNCDALTSITIPDGVASIGEGAFSYCDGLTAITLPDSVTSIGDEAFFFCDALTSITIPDSVISIGEWAFSECFSLTLTVTPDSFSHSYAQENDIPFRFV